MQSKTSGIDRVDPFRIFHRAVVVALLTALAGCVQPRQPADPIGEDLDLSRSGQHTSDDWTYIHSITNAGTRSEGHHGVLSHREIALPAPRHINDFYETPWGRLYWVGNPGVLFGAHGWMPKPLAREPVGRALIDPALVHSGRFLVLIKLVAPGELATPDRLEQDGAVLEALKPFRVTEAHAQSDWFAIGSDPITLHDTKRWGRLTVSRADLNMHPAPALEFACTGDFTVETSPQPASIAELMPPADLLARPERVFLSPQVGPLQPIQCTLTPIVGDPLVLYLVCRIEDQGPKPPWKSPNIRVYEAQVSTPATSDKLP